MVKKRRFLLYLPFVIAFCSLPGVMAPATGESDIENGIKVFTKVYNAVEENFADPLNTDKAFYKGAIPGMLRTVDPHSNFFDPHDFQSLREGQKGHYYGTGMTVTSRNRKIVIISPLTRSPP